MELPSIEELYQRYGALVRRRARAILGEEQAALDAMQEVFVRAMRERDGFRGEASPVTWLYRITTNLCLNRVRDHARRRELMEAQGPPPAGAPADSEDKAILASVLARVPEELREIAVYYYVDEMNQDEIAELTGLGRRTVGNRLEEFRAKARAAAGGGEAA